MQSGGDFLLEDIAWFNGGLFANVEQIELSPGEVSALNAASKMDWSAIEPSILGTMFERGLDPKIRAPLGANYTDPGTIMKLVNPVIVEPLAKEWADARARIALLLTKYHDGGKGSQTAFKEAQGLFLGFIERLKNFRVLDPACGSGNFLYLSLRALKDLEHRANLDAEALGLQRQLTIETSPANVLGIEINSYAAELARVTVWIGEIQWMLKNGYDCRRNPILATLDHIEKRDALLNGDGSEAEWPIADVIVGNPPFLGGSKMLGELGVDYCERLRQCYEGRVPAGADLVTYWFEKGRIQIEVGACQRVGLVATNSIRQETNRKVLERILSIAPIFNAWADEEWVNDGAAVRVSLVCFGSAEGSILNGENVESIIHPDLTAGDGLDLTKAMPLFDNSKIAYNGIKRNGPFDIDGNLARQWLVLPNPHGRSNIEVLHPMMNGNDLTKRPRDIWLIDFGTNPTVEEASLYEVPFEYAGRKIRSARQAAPTEKLRKFWWIHEGVRVGLRNKLVSLSRYAAISEKSKHFFWVWIDAHIFPDNRLVVVARDDDCTFGVLHSRAHELWALRKGSTLEDRPCYTPTTCFETFPFPSGLTPRDTANGTPTGPLAEAIAEAARRLNELRESWLNPPEWVDWVITPEEERAGFPKRPVAKPGHEAELKKRTLTNLYNQRPAWLDNAHKVLDKAVADAYGWSDYTAEMADEEILRRLLALNLKRRSSS